MRKVFLNNLPKRASYINWKNSIGYKIKFIYDDIEGEFEILDYKDSYVTISYNNKTYKTHSNKLKSSKIGGIVHDTVRENIGEFKFNIGDTLIKNNVNLTILDMKKVKSKNGEYNYKSYKYHCNNCGHEDWKIESSLINLTQCSCCSNRVVKKGINDIGTTRPDLIKYFKNKNDISKYSKGNMNEVELICPECGFVKMQKVANLSQYGFHCNLCSQSFSYPERFMGNLLNMLNIKFIPEYSPKWISPKRYDFYLPNKQIIIEMDGAWHYIDNNMNGQSKDDIQENDKYKDELAKSNNLKVIRIDSYNSEFNYIKNNILNSELNNVLNLKDVNWSELSNKLGNDKLITDLNNILKKYNINKKELINYIKNNL